MQRFWCELRFKILQIQVFCKKNQKTFKSSSGCYGIVAWKLRPDILRSPTENHTQQSISHLPQLLQLFLPHFPHLPRFPNPHPTHPTREQQKRPQSAIQAITKSAFHPIKKGKISSSNMYNIKTRPIASA